MLILGLDLSTHTGFALGTPGDRPQSWTEHYRVADDERMQAAQRLARSIDWWLEHTKPDLVVYERPLSGAVIARLTKTQSFIGDMLIGFAHIVEGIAALDRHRIRCESVSPNTHRKMFLGRSDYANPKRATISKARQLGWGTRTMDDNEADALSVWYWAGATFAPKLAAQTGPLFMAGGKCGV